MAPTHKTQAGPSRSKALAHKPSSKPAFKPAAAPPSRQHPSSPGVNKTQPSNPKKRKATPADDGDDSNARAKTRAAAPPKAPLLLPRIRNISATTVSTRWTPLPTLAQAAIVALMQTAQHPVLMTFVRETRRAEAQAVTGKLVARLQGLLPKVPVPSVGLGGLKDSGGARLSLEGLMERNATLESELQPALRNAAELEHELESQKRALEHEERSLRELERNAKLEERVRAEQLRAAPKLLRPPPAEIKDGYDNIAMCEDDTLRGSYRVEDDPKLLPLTRQLQQHLHSMHNNASGLVEVNQWISRSRAAVEEVLLESGLLTGAMQGV